MTLPLHVLGLSQLFGRSVEVKANDILMKAFIRLANSLKLTAANRSQCSVCMLLHVPRVLVDTMFSMHGVTCVPCVRRHNVQYAWCYMCSVCQSTQCSVCMVLHVLCVLVDTMFSMHGVTCAPCVSRHNVQYAWCYMCSVC